jgi:hypothetical protein
MPKLPLVLSPDSHVFEPSDLWQTRIDRTFRDRAPRIERIDGGDYVVVEADQIFSGIGLISNAGARFEAPETISAQGRLKTCSAGGGTTSNTSRTWRSMGWRAKSSMPRKGSSTPRWWTRR